jgi:uncharacterized protein (TIGR02147 family)
MQIENGYRHWLKHQLSEKCRTNPNYSMRAMARSFSISPSYLSQIINGKRNLTLKGATRIASRMKLQIREKEYFFALVEFENAKDPDTKVHLASRVARFPKKYNVENLSVDSFRLLSDWYHFPILQLIKIPGFEFSVNKIAAKLEISSQLAADAVTRLERLNLIKKNEAGKYVQVFENNIRVESKDANLALQTFHKQMLEKAITSLKSQTPQEKYVGSETIAFDSSQLPKVESMINEFMDQLLTLAQAAKKPDEVYHLNVMFFRLTKPEEK